MSANEIYCRLDNEGVSKRVARMVKTEMGKMCIRDRYEGNRVEITFRFHDEIADLLEELHQKQMGQREVLSLIHI